MEMSLFFIMAVILQYDIYKFTVKLNETFELNVVLKEAEAEYAAGPKDAASLQIF